MSRAIRSASYASLPLLWTFLLLCKSTAIKIAVANYGNIQLYYIGILGECQEAMGKYHKIKSRREAELFFIAPRQRRNKNVHRAGSEALCAERIRLDIIIKNSGAIFYTYFIVGGTSETCVWCAS